MSWYFPPPGTTVNSGQNNTYNISSGGNITITGIPSGDVVLQRPGNIYIAFPPSANTAAARGSALFSGAQASVSGDAIYLSAGFFDFADATAGIGLPIPTGVTLIGEGPYSTYLTTSLSYGAGGGNGTFIAASGAFAMRNLSIVSQNPTGNHVSLFIQGSNCQVQLENVNVSNLSTASTAGNCTLKISSSAQVYGYSCNLIDAPLNLQSAGYLELHDSIVFNNLSNQNLFGASVGAVTVVGYNTHFINAPTGTGPIHLYATNAANQVLIMYGGSLMLGGGSTGDAVKNSNLTSIVNLYGTRVVSSGGIAIRQSSTGYVRIADCNISGAVADLVRSNGNFFIDGPNTFTTTSGLAGNFIYGRNQGTINGLNAAVSTGSLLSSNGVAISTGGAGYTQLAGDVVIGFVGSAGGGIALLAAAGQSGRTIVIKDQIGSGAVSNITVSGAGSDKIDGASTKVINTAFGSMKLYTNGVNWFSY